MYMCICMYSYIHIYIHMYIHILHVYIYIYLYIYLFMLTFPSVYHYCIHIHTYLFNIYICSLTYQQNPLAGCCLQRWACPAALVPVIYIYVKIFQYILFYLHVYEYHTYIYGQQCWACFSTYLYVHEH